MKEVDILINPYYDWKSHTGGGGGDDEFCLLNVLMHEFGHAGGLEHVVYDPDEDDGYGNCPEWIPYTMRSGSGPNEHDKEVLECEDKWAIAHMY